MENYLNNVVLKSEISIFGIRGCLYCNSKFNEILNSKELKMELNKTYQTISDVIVRVKLDEFQVFTEVLWNDNIVLNFRGYPNSTSILKIEDLKFTPGENGYSEPFKNETLYKNKNISFRFFLDEKTIIHDFDMNNEFNW